MTPSQLGQGIEERDVPNRDLSLPLFLDQLQRSPTSSPLAVSPRAKERRGRRRQLIDPSLSRNDIGTLIFLVANDDDCHARRKLAFGVELRERVIQPLRQADESIVVVITAVEVLKR